MTAVNVVTVPSNGVPTPDVTGVLSPAPTQAVGAGADVYIGVNPGLPLATQNLGQFGTALNGRLNLSLIYWPGARAVKSLLMEVTTLGTGTVRFGVYGHSTTTGAPGALVVDFGAADATSTGVKELTASATIPQGWLWLGWAWQGTNTTGPIIRSRTGSTATSCTMPSNSFTVCSSWWVGSVAGALPATLTGLNYGSLNDVPAVMFRTA